MGSLKQWITVFFFNLTNALSACDNMIDENKYSVYDYKTLQDAAAGW